MPTVHSCRVCNSIWPVFGAAEIDNEDTLKVCMKITKITDLNLGFFEGMGDSEYEIPVRTFKLSI